jgi:hypothetical protein
MVEVVGAWYISYCHTNMIQLVMYALSAFTMLPVVQYFLGTHQQESLRWA